MELDFKTVKALSSPTRIRILNQVLDSEATPTYLSDELGKSKSTVSSHLVTLVEAGLVEKDKEEGRRRVLYRPTGKARDIVQGKEKRVKFSLASSFVSGLAGVALVSQQVFEGASERIYLTGSVQEDSAMAMADTADTAVETAPESGLEMLMEPSTAVLLLGLFLLSLSVMAFVYGLVMRELDR